MTPTTPHRLAPRATAAWLIAALLIGCPKPTPVELPTEAEVEPEQVAATAAVRVAARRAVPGLREVHCDDDGCSWFTATERVRFDLASLEPIGTEPLEHVGDRIESSPLSAVFGEHENPMDEILEGAQDEQTPEPEAPANPLQAEVALWSEWMAAGSPLPFHRRVPVVGGMVTYQRGLGGGGGKLLRMGGGFRTIDAPGTEHTVTCEGWLAPHPSGLEVYLLLWPTATLTAYDARALIPRWDLELPGPAQGLFVDPAGRFAMLALTEPPDPDRLTDYPPADLAGNAGLISDHPAHTHALLLDLASGRTAAQAEGSLVAWLPTPDGAWLMATDSELLRLEAR